MSLSTAKRRSLSRFVAVLGLLYPVAVLFGLRYLPPAALVGLLGAMLAVRLALGNRGSAELILGGAVLVALVLLGVSPLVAVRIYPVLMSLGFAALFLYSLWHPPMIVERVARLAEPDLPESAMPYLRKLTLAWIAFFFVNAAIAAWTVAYGTVAEWTLYNGLISYLLIGLMFGGEYLIRPLVRR
jgi:uncharacterized membrane protein